MKTFDVDVTRLILVEESATIEIEARTRRAAEKEARRVIREEGIDAETQLGDTLDAKRWRVSDTRERDW